MSITRDNHYVPRLYLKHFAAESGYLHRYRLLVSKQTIPEWKRVHIGGVAYQANLYTRALANEDSDDIEQWINRDFEAPAEDSIYKAVNDKQLGRKDYRLLVRFLLAQSVRTPAFLIRNLPRWQQTAQNQLETSMRTVKSMLENSHASGTPLVRRGPGPNAQYFPLRVTEDTSESGQRGLRVETVVGRASWIYAMRHILTSTINKLADHKWTILSAEDDLPWFTTGDPVVRVNFRTPSDYDFSSGWETPKSNIFLPLSPQHLLFTQVGGTSFQRGDSLPRNMAILVRKIIAEHAHRYIFSPHVDQTVTFLRPRFVDADAVKSEQEQWQRWHDEQSVAERHLIDNDLVNSPANKLVIR